MSYDPAEFKRDIAAVYAARDKAAGIVAGPAAATTTATDEWNQRIEEKVKSGLARHLAAQAVAREDPKLREAFVAETRKGGLQ